MGPPSRKDGPIIMVRIVHVKKSSITVRYVIIIIIIQLAYVLKAYLALIFHWWIAPMECISTQ